MKHRRILVAMLALVLAVGTGLTLLGNQLGNQNTLTVQAAGHHNKRKGNIQINSNDVFPVNKRGNYLNKYRGQKVSDPFADGTVLNCYGTKVIGHRLYFNIGSGAYVPGDGVEKIDGKDILRVNHNAYVFNKRGKRIKNYQGHKNFVIYIETPIKLAKKAEQLSNKTNKKFFFMENGNKYWLPYQTVKHKQYVYTGAKAYIKAANIGEVAGNRLLTNSAVAKLASRSYVNNRKRIPIYNDKGQATKNTLKAKSQVVVDYTVVSDQEDQDNDDGFTYYHIKGTKNEFLWHYDVQKLLSRQGLESKVITGMPGLEEY